MNRSLRMLVLALGAVLVAYALPGYGANAAETTSELLLHCAQCHIVPDVAPATSAPRPGTPSFQDMAEDDVTYSRDRLRSFFRQPHYPMKGLELSTTQIEEIIAYLDELKRRPR